MSQLLINPSGVLTPFKGGQAGFATDWSHRLCAIEGGWGSGKTLIGAYKLVSGHMINAFNADGSPTYHRSCVMGPTYQGLRDYDIPMLEEAFKVAGLKWKWKSQGNRFILPDLGRLSEPSEIICRTADDPALITGYDVALAWGDEPTRWPQSWDDPRKDAFLQLNGRVRAINAPFVQLMVTYTPEGDGTRMYEEFHSGKLDTAVYQVSTRDNPFMADYVKSLEGTLTPELAKQYIEGKTVSIVGARAYGAFLDTENVVEVKLDPVLPLQIAIDFNINPGMHIVVGQHFTADDCMTAAFEIHGPGWDVRRAVEALRTEVEARYGAVFPFPAVEVFGDASGHARSVNDSQTSYEVVALALQAWGVPFRLRVPVSERNPGVVDRLNAVNVACRDLRGVVHYKVDPSCRRLIRDFQMVKCDGKGGIEKKVNPELTHASDADGYRIAFLRPVRREMTMPPKGRVGFGRTA